MKKVEVWSVEIASSMYERVRETILVQASRPATAAERALRLAKSNGYSQYYNRREKSSLYVRSASFNDYVYLV